MQISFHLISSQPRSGGGGANAASHIRYGIPFWELLTTKDDMRFCAQDKVAFCINAHISDTAPDVPAISLVYLVIHVDGVAFPCGSPHDGLALVGLEFVSLAIENQGGRSSILMAQKELAAPFLRDRHQRIARIDELATKVGA